MNIGPKAVAASFTAALTAEVATRRRRANEPGATMAKRRDCFAIK